MQVGVVVSGLRVLDPKRHTMTLAALTTAGGTVLSASGNGSINGVTIALEGDAVSCPACKSSGKISCVEPRIPETSESQTSSAANYTCGSVTSPSAAITSWSIMSSHSNAGRKTAGRHSDLGGAVK
jgi:hypothetical protein